MIRPYKQEDFEAVTLLWHEAQRVAMPKLMARMGYSLEDSRKYFLNGVIQENQLWVYESNAEPVAYLAIKHDFIDRLYVSPAYHHMGIGQALLDRAKTASPKHLWLYTHVANKMARSFYEKNGFTAKKFGMSPEPESEPDVEYHWHGG